MKRSDNLDLAYRLIDQSMYITLSLIDPQGQPYSLPLSVIREGNQLYFHCALAGRKTDALRHCPQISLSCVGPVSVIPGAFSLAFQSVIATGTAVELKEESQKRRALALLSEHYCPADMAGFPAEMAAAFHRTALWRIDLESITTKG